MLSSSDISLSQLLPKSLAWLGHRDFHCCFLTLFPRAARGNASQGRNFPFHYHVPDVFQALKLLPVLAVWMHPSSVLEW